MDVLPSKSTASDYQMITMKQNVSQQHEYPETKGLYIFFYLFILYVQYVYTCFNISCLCCKIPCTLQTIYITHNKLKIQKKQAKSKKARQRCSLHLLMLIRPHVFTPITLQDVCHNAVRTDCWLNHCTKRFCTQNRLSVFGVICIS